MGISGRHFRDYHVYWLRAIASYEQSWSRTRGLSCPSECETGRLEMRP